MSHAWHRRVIAQAGFAAGLAALLGGCLSAPQGPTSEGAAGPVGGNVSINAVAQRYIDGSHFKRITEYFDNEENKGGHIIERTDPKDRTGYYFIVDLDWHPGVVMPKGTKVVLDYIRGDNTTPREAVFTFPNDQGTWSEVFLGLTGADWPSATTELVAYKLTFETASGQVLASHQSFLWALPDLAQKAPAVASDGGNTTTAAATSSAK
ncbi:MAG: hypothetical protein ABSH19_09490 [Opitutales bacterium]|jgi:hypothetical protein